MNAAIVAVYRPAIHPKPMRIQLTSLLLSALPCAAQYTSENLKVSPAPSTEVAPVLDKLGIFPVVASAEFLKAFDNMERSTPMKKAMGDGKLTLTEKSDGAEVNKLMAVNNGADTIYMMQGEVVSGGKQDRVLAQYDFAAAQGEERG